MRMTISQALLLGNGNGKPLGMLHAKSGIPVCETSPSTPPNQFTWQDLIMLKYALPMQWQNGGSYLMNQRTFAMLLTMSDAGERPIWSSLPGEEPGFPPRRFANHRRFPDARCLWGLDSRDVRQF